ncbi:hypothetical protein CLAIMM_10708 isoform 1 [Cladophialophora immunda]|nr:hypothetical protein CLAIMM_10708 isoform 1 [Cladophialophora immunda]
MIVPDFFATDPDWAAYAVKHGFPLPPDEPLDKHSLPRFDAHSWNFKAIREANAETEAVWARDHPLSSVGYETLLTNIRVRDGTLCSVKVSWPANPRHDKRFRGASAANSFPLPVLFVTHGGGWIRGTHQTEEAWLLWPLYNRFDVIVVSVEYRLAPEHRFPTWIEDSWDVLQRLVQDTRHFLPADCPAQIDPKTLYLAGSSSGGGISAVLSHRCRNHGIPVSGVILNVPVLCDYRDMSAIVPHMKKRETTSARSPCLATRRRSFRPASTHHMCCWSGSAERRGSTVCEEASATRFPCEVAGVSGGAAQLCSVLGAQNLSTVLGRFAERDGVVTERDQCISE